MTAKVSTGLRNAVLGSSSLKAAMALGFLRIFSGAAPADADAAETGTLLCIVSDTSGAGGLNYGTAASGVLPKDPSQVWSGNNVSTGTAGYFRLVGAADTGAVSTTQPRIQGTIGTVSADLVMSSTNLVALAPLVIDAGNITLPSA